MSKLKKYLLFTFIVAWIVECFGSYEKLHGGRAGREFFDNSLALCMIIPTLGALLAGADMKEMGWRLKLGKNWKYLLLAWLAPTVFQFIGALFYYIVFPDDFAPAEAFRRFMDAEDLKIFQEKGSPYAAFIVDVMIDSLTSFGIVIATIHALGEEIGWRGFMYPELKTNYGRTKGLLIGGVIHGAWHFPVMIIAGYEYGKNYIGAPVLGLVVFCMFTVSMGIVSDLLYTRSGSIWLPAIFHAMINSSTSPEIVKGDGHPERSIFGPSDIGIIGMLPMAACAAFLVWYQYKREQKELDELFGGDSFSG